MAQHHFLLLAFPAQGHLNPALQLARRLIRMGVLVTLSTTVHMHRRMDKSSTAIPGLSFAPFSDGYDDGYKFNEGSDTSEFSADHYFSELRRRGSESLANLIASVKQNGGHPFTCIVHTMLLHWATELARQVRLPSALLWVQPATVFAIFHYYFKDDDFIKNKLSSVSKSIELPGLPPLEKQELPSFITSPPDAYGFILPLLGEDLRILQQEPNPTVLVNTFEELEADALRVVHGEFRTIAIGPLVPSILLDGENRNPSDSRDDHMEWLSSKPESSVIYISFGSLCVLSRRQMEEMARGLIDSNRPFVWSIREDKEREKVGEYAEEMEEKGKIVRWCKQVEILSHKSVGCFVSHCGWNSSLESMVAGIPMVGIPQWSDQMTNAKLMEEVWKTGVRPKAEEGGDGRIVRGDEIRRCVEEVMGNGEGAMEMRKNAAKWKVASVEAVKAGGSGSSFGPHRQIGVPSPSSETIWTSESGTGVRSFDSVRQAESSFIFCF